jgi:hypothetical protein
MTLPGPPSDHLISVPFSMRFHLVISLGTVTRNWPFDSFMTLLQSLATGLWVRLDR